MKHRQTSAWRRSVSAGLGVLLLVAGLVAVFAPIHRALHDGDECSTPQCVVTALAQGLLDGPDHQPPLVLLPCSPHFFHPIAPSPLRAGPDRALPPGRAPPTLPFVS